MKNLLINLNHRPIAVYPVYIKLTGSVNAGLLLSQIMYWYSAVKGRTFYKSDAEIMEETMLSVNELRTAKLILMNFNCFNLSFAVLNSLRLVYMVYLQRHIIQLMKIY